MLLNRVVSLRALLLAVLPIAVLAAIAVSVRADDDVPAPPAGPRSAALTNTITYQGRVAQDGVPITGTCDFEFRLFNDSAAGNVVGQTVTRSGVMVEGGLFTTQLDFGAGVFNGEDRYLEATLRCPAGSGQFTLLTGRQALTPTPYAIYAVATGSSGGSGWSLTGNAGTNPATNFIGTTDNQALEIRVNNTRVYRFEPETGLPANTAPNIVGGQSANFASPGVFAATIAGGGFLTIFGPFANRVTDNLGTVGGGADNQAGDGSGTPGDASGATVAGGLGNVASGSRATIGGGGSNNAGGSNTTIGGGTVNAAGGDNATVGGGSNNSASGQNATIGGGTSNSASQPDTTVGGGSINAAGGQYATVAGGLGNTASALSATVGGGYSNTASATDASVLGGSVNTASGPYSTVPGGRDNISSGDFSFAAGHRALADDTGAFVWADSTDVQVASAGANTFNVRASGGIWLGTTSSPSIPAGHFIETSTGAYLTTAGVWATTSDRNLKTNFTAINTRDVLEKLVAMPVTTWNYKAEGSDILRMGPTAQDFYAAFGLGDSDKAIGTVDAQGVAFAAIQGLYDTMQDENAALREESAALRADNAALEDRISRLESAAGFKGAPAQSTPAWAYLAIAAAVAFAGVAVLRRR